MHDDIKAFHLRGTTDDSNLSQNRDTWTRAVEEQMRDEGYVPVLDLDEGFSLYYNKDTGLFDFHLTIYGLEVGAKAWQWAGVMFSKPVMRNTPKVKSEPS